jgi:hypothetical protein
MNTLAERLKKRREQELQLPRFANQCLFLSVYPYAAMGVPACAIDCEKKSPAAKGKCR